MVELLGNIIGWVFLGPLALGLGICILIFIGQLIKDHFFKAPKMAERAGKVAERLIAYMKQNYSGMTIERIDMSYLPNNISIDYQREAGRPLAGLEKISIYLERDLGFDLSGIKYDEQRDGGMDCRVLAERLIEGLPLPGFTYVVVSKTDSGSYEKKGEYRITNPTQSTYKIEPVTEHYTITTQQRYVVRKEEAHYYTDKPKKSKSNQADML